MSPNDIFFDWDLVMQRKATIFVIENSVIK